LETSFILKIAQWNDNRLGYLKHLAKFNIIHWHLLIHAPENNLLCLHWISVYTFNAIHCICHWVIEWCAILCDAAWEIQIITVTPPDPYLRCICCVSLILSDVIHSKLLSLYLVRPHHTTHTYIFMVLWERPTNSHNYSRLISCHL